MISNFCKLTKFSDKNLINSLNISKFSKVKLNYFSNSEQIKNNDKNMNQDKGNNNSSNTKQTPDDSKEFSKFHKVHGNMTGMDKVNGREGKSAGIGIKDAKLENINSARPEEGTYIYRGDLNLDTNPPPKKDVTDKLKK
jgi:hypothetical protein